MGLCYSRNKSNVSATNRCKEHAFSLSSCFSSQHFNKKEKQNRDGQPLEKKMRRRWRRGRKKRGKEKEKGQAEISMVEFSVRERAVWSLPTHSPEGRAEPLCNHSS